MRRGARYDQNNNTGTAVMHGKNSKFALAALSALLYAQGLLGVAAVTMVVMKERMHTEPPAQAVLVSAASPDAQVR